MPTPQVQRIHKLTGHREAVYTVQPSSDPAIIFSGAGDGMVVKWDLRNPEEGELIAQLPNSVYALHHLEDSDLLVAGHNYEGIHLLDWKSKKEIASLNLTTAAIFDIQSYKQDLLIATSDGMLIVVDRERWMVKKKLLASEKSVRTLAINPIKEEVAVGYSDHYIRVFDLNSYELKQEWVAHKNSVFTLAYTPDHQLLLSGSRDARLKAWSTGGKYELHEEVAAHLFAINHIEFSPDGKHFVTCSMDKSIKVWDLRERKLLKVIDKARHAGHGTSVNKLYWSSFNDQLVSASDDRSLSVWHIIF